MSRSVDTPTTVHASALSFGARMRAERERRNISIASIAESTKILGALLEGLENDDVSRWPTGFYRRAFMRAYASAIGLDPDATVKEFVECFPDPEEVPPPVQPAPVETGWRTLRIEPPNVRAWFAKGALVSGVRLRALAVTMDLFVLSVSGVALYAVLGVFWAPLAILAILYYAVAILLLGNTPGVCLFAVQSDEAEPGASDGRASRPVYVDSSSFVGFFK